MSRTTHARKKRIDMAARERQREKRKRREEKFILCLLVVGPPPKMGLTLSEFEQWKCSVRDYWLRLHIATDPPMNSNTPYQFYNSFMKWYDREKREAQKMPDIATKVKLTQAV
ncbi:hypothetical protein LCGC14_1305560 [marine sediment metagenome]|uniref:Uncharacterized protein n=1 Tax=marine sediment metagenome TaxID=412755 RepID=A0A0F9L8R6_9ZZZZ